MARTKRVSVKGMGADLFFGAGAPNTLADTQAEPIAAEPLHAEVATDDTEIDATDDVSHVPLPDRPTRSTTRRPHDTAAANQVASGRASASPSESSSLDPAIIEQIRKTVKVPGKEVSFVRLTAVEKGDLADIIYTYKRQGIKTTENEINRIAVNYMLLDYQEHGEESLLAKVLGALRA